MPDTPDTPQVTVTDGQGQRDAGATGGVAAKPSVLESLQGLVGPQQLLVWMLFFASGACGLIYEVLWCRQLGLIFGNTAQSLSAVLTAFMGGLALGSFVAGRLCHRLKRPLLTYGILELSIGAYCLMLPWLFSDTGPLVPIYRTLYGETGGGSLAPARFLISFAVLLVPTALMGATLPVLSQFLVQSRATLGRTVGALYAINSLGAVLGAAGAGFVLLPELGKAHTNMVAVACNITLGVLAIACGWRGKFGTPVGGEQPLADGSGAEAAQPHVGAHGSEDIAPISRRAVQAVVLTFGVTGFAAMATQIGWTRAISLATGSSTYAFSLIVAVFILGLSLGGMWGARVAPKTRDPLALLALVLLLIGLLNLLVAVLLGYGPVGFFLLLAWFRDCGWKIVLATQALGIALLIIAPTVLMGATLPLTLQVASRGSQGAGRTVGNVYAVNTLGAILGSFLGGLVLLPLLQTQNLLEVTALGYAVPAVVLFYLSQGRRSRRSAALFIVLILAVVLVSVFSPRWDRRLMSSGMYLLRSNDAIKAARELRFWDALPPFLKDCELLYCKEGAEATVAVVKVPSGLSLRVGGKPDASSYGDMRTQVTLTLVPEILHAAGPKDVLVIGLGSGVSAGCALAPETVEHVDVVEMSPEVVEASYEFRKFNKLTYTEQEPRRLATPKVELILNDGRNHLLLTKRRYDIIASEPSNPWMAGVGNLFTKEAFELSRGCLKPGGIMTQWLHSYSLEETHFLSIVRTFSEVFRDTQLWNCGTGDYLLLGSDTKIEIPVQRLCARLAQPAVRTWLAQLHFDTPFEFLAYELADDAALRERTSPGNAAAAPALHTDDNMLLEFQAPRSLYKTEQKFRPSMFTPCPDVLLDFAGLKAEERAEFVRQLDLAVSAREHTRGLIPELSEVRHNAALTLAPYQYAALEHRQFKDEEEADKLLTGRRPSSTRDPAAAARMLERAAERSKYVRRNKALLNRALTDNAKALLAVGDTAGALAELDKIAAEDRYQDAWMTRARVLSARNEFDKALAQAIEAGKDGIRPVECTALAVEILIRAGRPGDAYATLEQFLSVPFARSDPLAAPLWSMWAGLLLDRRAYGAALDAILLAENLAPSNAGYVRFEARILTRQGRLMDAVQTLRRRAALDPMNELALGDLALALQTAAEGIRGQNPGLALRMLYEMRRVSRELTVLHSGSALGWETLCRSFLALGQCDPANAVGYRQEAQGAYQKAAELRAAGGSKMPPDLTAIFGQ